MSYASYWNNILSEEHRATVEELKDRRKKWSRARLEASGMSIFGASAEPDSEVFGDKIVRIYKNLPSVSKVVRRGKLLRDSFSRGDVLVLTPENHGLGRNNDYPIVPREGLVVDVGDDWLTLAVGNSWPLGLWETRRKNAGAFLVRLDRTAAQAPMKAQKGALEQLRCGNAGKATMILAGLSYGGEATKHYLNESGKKPSHFTNGYDDLDDEIWNAIEKTRNEISFKPNQSQMDAIAFALQRRVSLIRGPPGTGKTRCAAMLIATALKMRIKENVNVDSFESESNNINSKPPRILAVAHSNGAADVLLEALLNMGVPAVRMGRPSSVSPKVQHRTVVAIAEKIPAVVRLRGKANDNSLDMQSRAAAEFDLKRYITDTKKVIMETAPVIVASCIGANQLLDEDVSFPIVVLDEAAQTTEPALVCSLAVAKAEQVILIGDTKQLPPTITSVELRDTLGVSPMSRLEKVGISEVTLGIQYRMHPTLLQHPSNYFYDGLVKCATEHNSAKYNALPAGFPWPKSLPLAFIDSGVNNEITHNFGGRSNPTETQIVMRIICDLLNHGDINARDIAVISPYSKQVQAIRMELSMNEGRCRNKNIFQVKVGTVDSFQGQETDLVIFSAVRSNELKEMGFLRDPRRLNVAITRARKGLILIGDKRLLKTCRHWSSLLDSCDERGCLVDVTSLQKEKIESSPSESLQEENYSSLQNNSDEFYGLFSPQ